MFVALRRIVALVVAAHLAVACGSDGSSTSGEEGTGTVTVLGTKTEPSYQMCSASFSKSDVVRLFNGTLVWVGQVKEKGDSAAKAVDSMIADIVLNGLDFNKLGTYEFEYDNGVYTYQSGGEGYTFVLTFATDWETYKAGDKIPYNVFDYESYLSDISVSILPTPSLTYEHGPLWNLIDGSVNTNPKSLSDLGISFKLHTEVIAFALTTANTYNGQIPRTADTFLMKQETTPTALPDIKTAMADGTFHVTYAGSTYTSVYYGILQTFTLADASLTHDDTGYYQVLPYEATIAKSGITFYQKGLASQQETNYTGYYCDQAFAEELGMATHDADLQGGTFKFADGTEIRYGLGAF
jgi:hypothetical protein